MSPVDHELIVWLLVATLLTVFGLGALSAVLVLRSRTTHQMVIPPQIESEAELAAEAPVINDSPHSLFLAWKRPACWLAIKNHNLQAVQSALGLHNSKPCTWVEGLVGDSEQRLFISSPVSGWILVIGPGLPDPAEDIDLCYRLVVQLSRKLGYVQFFSANTMLNHHAWAQAEHGEILRAYAWAGKTLWNQGTVTSAEKDLRLKCYDYSESAEVPQFGAPDPAAHNADKVHLLAARWSVDPEDIDEHFIEHEWGIVGQRTRLF